MRYCFIRPQISHGKQTAASRHMGGAGLGQRRKGMARHFHCSCKPDTGAIDRTAMQIFDGCPRDRMNHEIEMS